MAHISVAFRRDSGSRFLSQMDIYGVRRSTRFYRRARARLFCQGFRRNIPGASQKPGDAACQEVILLPAAWHGIARDSFTVFRTVFRICHIHSDEDRIGSGYFQDCGCSLSYLFRGILWKFFIRLSAVVMRGLFGRVPDCCFLGPMDDQQKPKSTRRSHMGLRFGPNTEDGDHLHRDSRVRSSQYSGRY